MNRKPKARRRREITLEEYIEYLKERSLQAALREDYDTAARLTWTIGALHACGRPSARMGSRPPGWHVKQARKAAC